MHLDAVRLDLASASYLSPYRLQAGLMAEASTNRADAGRPNRRAASQASPNGNQRDGQVWVQPLPKRPYGAEPGRRKSPSGGEGRVVFCSLVVVSRDACSSWHPEQVATCATLFRIGCPTATP